MKKIYKYYYLYQMTNVVDGKIYIGVHRTNNLDDGYMGSGILLKRAIKKIGIENFKKEILFYFDNEEEMFSKEIEYVNREFVLREDTYNITEGGYGGSYSAVSKGGKTERTGNGGRAVFAKKIGIFSKTGIENAKKFLISEENLRRLEEYRNTIISLEEIKQKRKETFKKINHQKGEKNSQYGTMWITNGMENKKIKKEEEIPDGWYKGRKIK